MIQLMVQSYGWTARETKRGVELYNRNNMLCAIIISRGKRYLSVGWDSIQKIASAPTAERAAEITMKDYFYAEKLAHS
jgi:hypothetical protein